MSGFYLYFIFLIKASSICECPLVLAPESFSSNCLMLGVNAVSLMSNKVCIKKPEGGLLQNIWEIIVFKPKHCSLLPLGELSITFVLFLSLVLWLRQRFQIGINQKWSIGEWILLTAHFCRNNLQLFYVRCPSWWNLALNHWATTVVNLWKSNQRSMDILIVAFRSHKMLSQHSHHFSPSYIFFTEFLQLNILHIVHFF